MVHKVGFWSRLQIAQKCGCLIPSLHKCKIQLHDRYCNYKQYFRAKTCYNFYYNNILMEKTNSKSVQKSTIYNQYDEILDLDCFNVISRVLEKVSEF